MNRKEANLEIIELLKERILQNTDERFEQMLNNLRIGKDDNYNVESTATLGHLKTVMKE